MKGEPVVSRHFCIEDTTVQGAKSRLQHQIEVAEDLWQASQDSEVFLDVHLDLTENLQPGRVQLKGVFQLSRSPESHRAQKAAGRFSSGFL